MVSSSFRKHFSEDNVWSLYGISLPYKDQTSDLQKKNYTRFEIFTQRIMYNRYSMCIMYKNKYVL